MRIIAGKYRGHSLSAPKGHKTRPTSDRVRESLFSILGDLEGAKVLDLYAGSGAVALEACSRGAEKVTLVEKAGPALSVISANISALKLPHENYQLLRQDVSKALPWLAQREQSFDLIFADPPYKLAAKSFETILELAPQLLAPEGALVFEQAARDAAPPEAPGLEGPELRKYGEAMLCFYDKA